MSVDFVRHLEEHQAFLKVKAKPLYLGSMTTTQRNLLPLLNGLEIFNSTTGQYEYCVGGAWITWAIFGAHHATHEPGGIDEVNDIDILNTGVLLSAHRARHEPGGADLVRDIDILGTGVLLSAHETRHRPGGADALPVGIPSNIGAANVAGILNEFVRRDHVHAHGNLSGLVSPAHAHADLSGVSADQHHAQLHAASHLVGAGDPLSVGTPVAISTANAEGVATNFCRRDHVHAMIAGHPSDPYFPANAKGVIRVTWRNSVFESYNTLRLYDQFGAAAVAGSNVVGSVNDANWHITEGSPFSFPAGLKSFQIQVSTTSPAVSSTLEISKVDMQIEKG